MMKYGSEPFLECSSRGDKRFSALYARIEARGNRSIEEIYQSAKKFSDGSSGHDWKTAKHLSYKLEIVNYDEVSSLYEDLWMEYFNENATLIFEILKYRGFSDQFAGEKSTNNQARVIYDLWKSLVSELQSSTIVGSKYKPSVMPDNQVYIGRRKDSDKHFGNPFGVEDRSREEACDMFDDWIFERDHLEVEPERRSWILSNLHELLGKEMICFCKPKRCHGDSYIKLLKSYYDCSETG